MKNLTLIIFLFSSSALFSQSAVISSTHCYGGSSSELGNDVSRSYDGRYWLAGYSYSSDYDVTGNNGGYDFWVCKVNTAGTVISQDNYGGSGDDFAETIEETSDSGRIVFGTTWSGDIDVTASHGYTEFWLVRLKKNGAFLWKKCFGGSMYDFGRQLSMGPDESYYCAGTTNSKNGNIVGKHKLYDAWVIRVNDAGTLLWQKCIGGNGDDEANSIYTTSDGGAIIAGSTNKNGGDISGWHGAKDFMVSKLNDAGTVEWTKVFGGTADDVANAVVQTDDGGYIVTGYTNSVDGDIVFNHGGGDVWVIKLDASGTLVWQYTYGGSGSESGSDIIQTDDGGYAICATLDAYSNSLTGADFTSYHNYYDYWIIKIDAAGSIDWNGVYGSNSHDVPASILQNASGELAVAGYAAFNSCDISDSHGVIAGYGDYWLLILGDDECLKPANLTSSSAFGYATMSWCPVAGAVTYEIKWRPVGGTYTAYTTFNGNETSHSISVAPLTTYEWKVRSNCSAGSSAFTVLQSFTTPARTGETIENINLSIYPNPAKNKITLSLPAENADVFIYDMTGKLITHEMSNEIQKEIDISFYSTGAYLVAVKYDDRVMKGIFVKE
ncbi:MAG: T9SS type A sorting domain-containing protein [Chitinophagales bacterium]